MDEFGVEGDAAGLAFDDGQPGLRVVAALPVGDGEPFAGGGVVGVVGEGGQPGGEGRVEVFLFEVAKSQVVVVAGHARVEADDLLVGDGGFLVAFEAEQQIAELRPDQHVVRLEFGEAFELGRCGLEIARFAERGDEVFDGGRIIGFVLQRGVVRRDGLGKLAQPALGKAEVAVRGGVFGTERDGLAICARRLVKPAQIEIGVAEFVVCFGVVRRRLNGVLEPRQFRDGTGFQRRFRLGTAAGVRAAGRYGRA